MKEMLTFLHSQHGPKPISFEWLKWRNGPKPNFSVEEPFKLELKPLPSNLKYVFPSPSHLFF